MMRDYLRIAIFISLLIHLILFLGIGYLSVKDYRNNRQSPNNIEIATTDSTTTDKDYVKQVKKMLTNITPPPYRAQGTDFLTQPKSKNSFFEEPGDEDRLKTKLNLILQIPEMQQLKKNPAYMDYYQSIRQKIKKNIYQSRDLSTAGEVSLSFTILKTGNLASLNVGNQGQSKKLLDIATESVRAAAPFMPFPEELPYSRLRFNLAIYFKSD